MCVRASAKNLHMNACATLLTPTWLRQGAIDSCQLALAEHLGAQVCQAHQGSQLQVKGLHMCAFCQLAELLSRSSSSKAILHVAVPQRFEVSMLMILVRTAANRVPVCWAL